jgi:hypothetical protein
LLLVLEGLDAVLETMREMLVLTRLGQSKEVLLNLPQKVAVLVDLLALVMAVMVDLVEVVDMMMLVDQQFRVRKAEKVVR